MRQAATVHEDMYCKEEKLSRLGEAEGKEPHTWALTVQDRSLLVHLLSHPSSALDATLHSIVASI